MLETIDYLPCLLFVTVELVSLIIAYLITLSAFEQQTSAANRIVVASPTFSLGSLISAKEFPLSLKGSGEFLGHCEQVATRDSWNQG